MGMKKRLNKVMKPILKKRMQEKRSKEIKEAVKESMIQEAEKLKENKEEIKRNPLLSKMKFLKGDENESREHKSSEEE